MVWISRPALREPGFRPARIAELRRARNAGEVRTWIADPDLSNTSDDPPIVICIGVTHRQLECLAWAAEGKTAGEIGTILGISGRTVESHLAKLCDTLGVRKRIQAVECARRLGLLRLSG